MIKYKRKMKHQDKWIFQALLKVQLAQKKYFL